MNLLASPVAGMRTLSRSPAAEISVIVGSGVAHRNPTSSSTEGART
jgi:hypothetical protein